MELVMSQDLKSLTVEVTPAGMAHLYIKVDDTRVTLILTPEEKGRLADALFRPGATTEIANY
jgi:hypothetical protein